MTILLSRKMSTGSFSVRLRALMKGEAELEPHLPAPSQVCLARKACS